jgi:PAS domain S-box-containing protein
VIEALKNLSFRTLFDAIADAAIVIENTGHVVLTNPAAHQLFGYNENELMGLAVEMLITPRYRKQYRYYQTLFFDKPAKLPMGTGNEIMVCNRSGQEMLLDVSFSPIEAQQQLYVLITFAVSRQHLKVEDTLRASEERLRLARQATGFGTFDYDFKRGVVYWDRQMREFWGGYPGEIISYEGFVAMIHPADRASRQAALDYAMNPVSHGAYKAEYRVIDPLDKTERWIAVVGRVYFEGGSANRLVSVARDVTEQKIFHDQMRIPRNEAGDIFEQQVTARTASAIAHELNQPLTAISAYSEVVLHTLRNDSFDVERLKNALQGCVEQTQRAGRGLHELIVFLQKSELATETLDLNDVIREALDVVVNDGSEKFRSRLKLEKDLPAVQCNRTQVHKVLVNLFRNAAEAMQTTDSPILTIITQVQALNDKNRVLVSVQDNGPGLDQAMAKRIFEPFFTTKQTGIGMGLAISQALIEANGGELWVESDERSGTQFYFTLPFAPESCLS